MATTPRKTRLRYVPLLTAGMLVFLGLIFLGRFTGLLWHSRTFGWWVPLDPFILGPTVDWLAWASCFLISIAPSVLKVARRNTKPDIVIILTSFVFPFLSLVAVSMSFYLGATLLVGSGFLAAHMLVSRSEVLLGMERRSTIRLVLTEIFAFLAVTAAGGVVSILLLQEGVFMALILGYDSTDALLSMLRVDMESFYLVRPILLALLAGLGVAAVLALFREPLQSLARPIIVRVRKEQPTAVAPVGMGTTRELRERRISLRGISPYLILVASVALGFSIAAYAYGYPYGVARVDRVMGSDMWFYIDRLTVMNSVSNPFSVLELDRGFFVLSLYTLMSLTHLEVYWVMILTPGLCSGLLAVSTFLLVKEGTNESWLAAFAALLSVVSSQTSLGMGAGIMANWFALSFVNFMFALSIRAIKLRSKLAAIGSIVLSAVLLWSYAYMWVATVAVLFVVVIATFLSFRSEPRPEWRSESTFLTAILAGALALPVILFYVLTSLAVRSAAGFDLNAWFLGAWNQISGNISTQVLTSAPHALEEAFDFAGNRVDLPFLTLLSIVGLVSSTSQTRSFRRYVAAMVVVPLAITMISPDLYHTWRGLYIIPIYLTGALGAGSIVRMVNGRESSWRSPSRLASAGTFAAYVFLTHLSYSLRALELLILATIYT